MRARNSQHGLTLVELIVTVFVMGIISAITLAVFIRGSETLGRVDDDVRGQGDLKIVTERLSRDLRAARGVDAGASASQLKIWIDENSDYARTAGEVITWRLSGAADGDGHYSVLREVSGVSQEVGRALVSNIAFTYWKNPAGVEVQIGTPCVTSPCPAIVGVDKSQIVGVGMEYDAITDAYLQKKKSTFKLRLRNVQ